MSAVGTGPERGSLAAANLDGAAPLLKEGGRHLYISRNHRAPILEPDRLHRHPSSNVY